MKSLNNIKKHHVVFLLVIALILYVIIGRMLIVQERKCIFNEGQTTICKVYNVRCDGEVKTCDGEYFFYFQGKKYFGYYIIEQDKINPKGKYYKVFFLPKTPNKNAVDYTVEIDADSVYKYFPQGKNPFELDSPPLQHE